MDEKIRFIDSLVDLRARFGDIPWILGGDFNMIKSLAEKKGGTVTLNKDSSAFQTFMDSMKLVNILSSNDLFTWNNKRGGQSLVASKLNRFIISEDLMLNNKEMVASILPFGGSDHWLVQLEVKGIGTPKNNPFRFENIWLNHPDFINNISSWWSEDLHIQGTKRNTRFFHRSTLENRSHNRISTIKDEGGQLLNSHEDIEVVPVQHFRGIAKETILGREHFIKDLTRHIPILASKEDNFNLNRLVTKEEISEVLKEMHNGKALGPDGFNVNFFKACWNIVKQDILNVVEDSKRNRTILKALNTSFISLIPKQDNALTPDKFRPIALCNVVYKKISKVVANRLKPLLPTLVSEEQSSYVEGRQILNNIIQAQEVVHSMTSNRKARMIMQLDLAKAYDKLNWTYIERVLIAFGFDHNWVKWVMALVTSPSFSILVNGSPSETFIPSRGLR
eukprot:PITA_31662